MTPRLLWFAAAAITVQLIQGHTDILLPSKPQQYRLAFIEYAEERKMVLPMDDRDPSKRISNIEKKQLGYLYGPPLLGNTSFFVAGNLGQLMAQQQQDKWYSDAAWLVNSVSEEAELAAAALKKAGGLKSPLDFQHLYTDQWRNSVPLGATSGVLTNFTSDLLFAMERLSVNPYPIKRLHPTADSLPFIMSNEIAVQLAGKSLKDLHRDGRLFIVDHSYQAKYPTSEGRYTAACQCYFYIHPISGDFLPLAIKTGVGSDLIYTPLDEEEDWLLAKAMFNMNDLFHGQIFHLANSHAVAEIVHLSALRTLSDEHPVLVLLSRLLYQAYAIRPVGETVLFNPGGVFEQVFTITNEGVRQFATEFYSKVAGLFESNYFHRDLVSRGVLNCTYGPALKSIPFFEDASVIHSSIQGFITSFVDAYYSSDQVLALDNELQSWVREASEKALVLDFPASPLVHKSTLVDILTHIAFLAGVSHSVLNSGEPVTTSGVLPLHPASLYAPVPMRKGVKDIMPFLPDAANAVDHIALLARFNRPQLVSENNTLTYMFSSEELLERGCDAVEQAVKEFRQEMEAFSREIKNRSFDADGLSQGMPFVWKGLDPGEIPFMLGV